MFMLRAPAFAAAPIIAVMAYAQTNRSRILEARNERF